MTNEADLILRDLVVQSFAGLAAAIQEARIRDLELELSYARAFLTPIAGPWRSCGAEAGSVQWERWTIGPQQQGLSDLPCIWSADGDDDCLVERAEFDAALRSAGWFLRDAEEEG